jgi:alkylation response protein AidB-like acyl-CoA dehydrogenase
MLRRVRGMKHSSHGEYAVRKEVVLMDLQFTKEELAFRDEVRAFIEANVPADARRKVLEGLEVSRDDTVRWQQILHRKGWGGPNWPKEFGGTGWDPIHQFVFEEESAAAGAPYLLPFGLKMVGPVIMRFGNPAQQQRFLPRILSGEDWWCQGYSEPGSGSDLASLKTRAERKGDRYLVNGQKTWITLAQYANWIFCLVRTNPAAKPQSGISFMLIDMKSPGVTVRPITLLDGSHEVNEVWFEDVNVPVENLVGEENSGWTYAKFLLGHERANIAGVGTSKRQLARLKRIASKERKNGRPLLEDPVFAAHVAQIEVELMALEITNLRVLSAEAERRAPGPEASLLKIRGSEIQQAISELMMKAVGPYALPFLREARRGGGSNEAVGPEYAAPLAATYLNMRKTSIYSGSNEIQKNIIAQIILGL